ncbi:hypothetical protein RFI_18831 [Reticulomyxa filosa]|uniref:Uncharacterized protein n=1 Tax=Reticulomyxa filosa TaxID=46433 RepID=X6MZF1_RETFI|nr:hypothetical protein RFI_18831 [Reticulomyxa filosa]|eukprot:ETO18430.1 hypothetical protein RFI_18831 [Reticulomyxa filosa]
MNLRNSEEEREERGRKIKDVNPIPPYDTSKKHNNKTKQLQSDAKVDFFCFNDFGKCKRRIDIKNLDSMTISTTSDEFAFHIPEEYDYRFKAEQKNEIVNVVKEAYTNIHNQSGEKLRVQSTDQYSLLPLVIQKGATTIVDREVRLRRYRELMDNVLEGNVEDEEDQQAFFSSAGAYDGDTNKRMSTSSQVSPSDFEFLKVIGRGSFGKVMLVRQKTTKQVFAMKILKKKAIIERNQVEHTKAEKSILLALQHPFCMTLHCAFQTDTKLYFVLDYFRGGELFFHLKKVRRFKENEARFFCAEVASALGHLHSLGIVYRDLKPENILLDHTGHICVTDFGLSKELGDDLHSYTFCGTPEYLGMPTFICLFVVYFKKVFALVFFVFHKIAFYTSFFFILDYFFLEKNLYNFQTGIPPFYSQNVNEMYRKIQSSPLMFPSNIFLTLPCKAIISEFLERNPKKRLGCGKDDVKEIMRHPFYQDLDWDLLYKKELEPPYNPQVKGGDTDTSMFDKQFTSEPTVDSYLSEPVIADSEDFKDFNYNGKPKPDEDAE